MDIIIGAGISGLGYAAATLHDYTIIEREDRVGGYCKTFYEGDYVWDYSGHFFHFQHPKIKDYVMEQIAEEEMLSVQKKTQIIYNGRHIDFPFQMNIHQLEKEEFIDCLYDLFNIPEDADKNITSFKTMLYAKFGRGIAEKFLIPYNSKLYATDLDKLDVDAMGRFFPYADKEQIIRNFRNTTNKSYNATFLYPKRGCVRVVESVASHVDSSKIFFNENCLKIDTEHQIVHTDKRDIHYDHLISSMPFTHLMDACGIEYDKEIYSCNKVMVFNLGFDSKGPETQNNWIYFPNTNLVFYRVGFYDNILQQNKMSLYVEIGFNHSEKIPDEQELLQRTMEDLRKVGIVTTQKLIAHNTLVMDPAYVHITKSSEQDKQDKMEQLASKNIYSIGRYGAWKYCSLEDNLFDAFELAKRIG
ncbi:MAG: FAD-dependent oxidoreductase [Bacteroidales bacterium]|nr:FAD-dependent oxidoreductase [Candidatus Colimorpha pelethequi]